MARFAPYTSLDGGAESVGVLLDAFLRPGAMNVLRPLLRHPDDRARHLAALALAFRAIQKGTKDDEVVPTLIEALDDERDIEGTHG